ncbi:MAG TPA: hypothetical protein VGD36_06095 [Xanthobacteraceae bacterium]|jgi:hypothetical protein
MPPRLSEYTPADWKRLRPLTQYAKTLRYGLITQRYAAKPPRRGSAAGVAQAIGGRDALFTVAFADPQAIAWQAALVRHYVPRALHVIADNSPDAAAAAAVEAAAAAAGVPYLWLPDNPWDLSRSHGLALNWLWRNVVRPGQPHAFGFLDDDLFPTAPDDPFAMLDRQPVFGLVRTAAPRWFLWAGFCVFAFAAVREQPLDFGQDWFCGLDTGGGNWNPLYSGLDLPTLHSAPFRAVPYRDGVPLAEGPMQWCGSWLHEVGVQGRPELQADKRRVVAGILAPHLQAAGFGTVRSRGS